MLPLIFLYSFFLTITLPALFPTLRLDYFVPFLVFAFYRSSNSKTKCLWLALICGLIFDLLSATTHFGLVALNYTLTVYILFYFKNYFFEDAFTTLPIMTLTFIYLSAFVQLILNFTFTTYPIANWDWFKIEFIQLPIYNLIYTIVAFAWVPLIFPHKLKKAPLIVKFKN